MAGVAIVILQLWPPRLVRGTIEAQRRDAASLALTLRTLAVHRARSAAGISEGWVTRRRNRAEARAVRRREWAADLKTGSNH